MVSGDKQLRPTGGKTAMQARPATLINKFTGIQGNTPTIEYDDEMKRAIGQVDASAATGKLLDGVSDVEKEKLLRLLIAAAMNHIASPKDKFPRTFAAALYKAKTTKAIDTLVFSKWSGHRDLTIKCATIHALAEKHNLDYMINAPAMLVVLMLKMIRGITGESDKVSRTITRHKLWHKMPTAARRWEQGNRDTFFPMVCPSFASFFAQGSHMETWQKYQGGGAYSSCSDEDGAGDAATADQEALANRQAESIWAWTAAKPSRVQQPTVMQQPAMTGAVMIDMLCNINSDQDTQMDQIAITFGKSRVITREMVEEELAGALAGIGDRHADKSAIEATISRVVDGTSVRVMDPDHRFKLHMWMMAHGDRTNKTCRLLEEHLETDEDSIVCKDAGSNMEIPIWSEYPVSIIAGTLEKLAVRMEPLPLAQCMAEKARQLRGAEVIYKNTIRELTAMHAAMDQAKSEANTRLMHASWAMANVAQGVRDVAGQDSLLYHDLFNFLSNVEPCLLEAAGNWVDLASYADRERDFRSKGQAMTTANNHPGKRQAIVGVFAQLYCVLKEMSGEEGQGSRVRLAQEMWKELVSLVGGESMRQLVRHRIHEMSADDHKATTAAGRETIEASHGSQGEEHEDERMSDVSANQTAHVDYGESARASHV